MKQASFRLSIAAILLPSCSVPGIKHSFADKFSGLWLIFDAACQSFATTSHLMVSAACLLLRLDQHAARARTFCTAMSWMTGVRRIS